MKRWALVVLLAAIIFSSIRSSGYSETTDIYFHDGTSIRRITDNAYFDMIVDINGSGDIVWQGQWLLGVNYLD